jgi:hypothetical protein
MQVQDQVRTTVDVVLDPHADASARVAALTALHAALVPLTGIPPYAFEDPFWKNAPAAHGLMIAPGYAADSIVDEPTTTAVWRDVDASIRARLDRGERCSVLLAQAGPLGALVLPLLHRYPAGSVEVTIVDIWSGNLAALAQVMGAMGVDASAVGLVHADPCFFATEHRFDVVVVLMAQRALGTQPQLAAMLNLAPLLKPDGVLVPKSFRLRMFYLNLEDELGVVKGRLSRSVGEPDTRRRELIAELLCADRAWLEARLQDSPVWRRDGFWLGDVEVPRRLADDECLALDATPEFGNSDPVSPWQSGLTAPELVRSLPGFDGPGHLKVGFNTGPDPGIRLVP